MQKGKDKRIEFKIENLSDKDLLISGYDLLNGTCGGGLKIEKVHLDSDILNLGVGVVRLISVDDTISVKDIVNYVSFLDFFWSVDVHPFSCNYTHNMVDIVIDKDKLKFIDLLFTLKRKSLVKLIVFSSSH